MVALVHPCLSGVGPWICPQPLCPPRDPVWAVSSTRGLHLDADKSQMRFPESGPSQSAVPRAFRALHGEHSAQPADPTHPRLTLLSFPPDVPFLLDSLSVESPILHRQ